MTTYASQLLLSSSYRNPHQRFSVNNVITNSYPSITLRRYALARSKPLPASKSFNLPGYYSLFSVAPFTAIRASSHEFLESTEDDELFRIFEEKPARFLFWVVFWASLSIAWFAASKDANAVVDSIKASSFGLKIANALRGLGWPDEAVVFALATLPVIELRGAIPVGYWMQLKPVALTVLSVLG